MYATEKNAGKAWTTEELEQLRRLAASNTPARKIAEELGRSEYAVRAKASDAHISFGNAKGPRPK